MATAQPLLKKEPWRDESIAANGLRVKENFASFSAGTAAVDENGNPQVVYHATDADFDDFLYTEDIGFHFGSAQTANARCMQAELTDACVMPVYLSVRNPLRLPDLHTWSPGAVLSALVKAGVITCEQADEADCVGQEEVRNWLEARGFDGIVYRNETEGGGDCYIVFRPERIKSASGNSGLYLPSSPSLTDRDAALALETAAEARQILSAQSRKLLAPAP